MPPLAASFGPDVALLLLTLVLCLCSDNAGQNWSVS